MDRSRIVVTGASGFLGRHLVDALRREHEVVAISRASPHSRGTTLPAGVRWLYLDVAESAALRRGGSPVTSRPRFSTPPGGRASRATSSSGRRSWRPRRPC